MVRATVFQREKIAPMENLGNRVAQARMEKGWEQKDLAREVRRLNPELKTAVSTISSIERGGSKSPTILYELAHVLGVTERWLKTGQQPKMRSASALMERTTEEAVTAVFAALLGVLQAMKFEPEEAEELAQIVRATAEEPLTGELPKDFATARRILAASATRKFLNLRRIKLSRA